MNIGDKVIYVGYYHPYRYVKRDGIYTIKKLFNRDGVDMLTLCEIIHAHSYYIDEFFALDT